MWLNFPKDESLWLIWENYPKQAQKCQEFCKIWNSVFLTHWTPVPTVTVTSIGLCSTSDFFTIDQTWHQRYPDQSDWLNGCARKCSEIWLKITEQTCNNASKILHGINCPSQWSFLCNNYSWTGSKPSIRSIIAAKRYKKKRLERWEKNEKSKDVGLISVHPQTKML